MLFFLVVVWGTLALFWSNIPWAPLRLVLACAFAGMGSLVLWRARKNRFGPLAWTFCCALAVLSLWWATIQPSHERDWQPQVAILPRAEIDRDHVRISGFRNFDYRSKDDFDIRFEQREVSLSDLESLDLVVSYFAPTELMAHVLLSFGFAGSDPICISIEARFEVGEKYSPLMSCFKQYELIYVVGSERDLLGLRSLHRSEDVYLYRVNATPEEIRTLFLAYMDRINALIDRPRWYHLLSDNCTSDVVRLTGVGTKRHPLDVRLLFNGYADRFAYDHDLLDTSVPYPELRSRARIRPVDSISDDPSEFSARIRSRPES
jgi:hypothetical protein